MLHPPTLQTAHLGVLRSGRYWSLLRTDAVSSPTVVDATKPSKPAGMTCDPKGWRSHPIAAAIDELDQGRRKEGCRRLR